MGFGVDGARRGRGCDAAEAAGVGTDCLVGPCARTGSRGSRRTGSEGGDGTTDSTGGVGSSVGRRTTAAPGRTRVVHATRRALPGCGGRPRSSGVRPPSSGARRPDGTERSRARLARRSPGRWPVRAVDLADPLTGHEAAERVPSERHDERRVEDLELAVEIRRAGRDLVRLRVAVVRRAALHDVRDEDLVALASRSWPASSRAGRRHDPTNGRPCRSSFWPGPSPTNTTSVDGCPSPGTARSASRGGGSACRSGPPWRWPRAPPGARPPSCGSCPL